MQYNNDDLGWRINELYEQLSGSSSFWGEIADRITAEFDEPFSKDRVIGIWRRRKDLFDSKNDSGSSVPDNKQFADEETGYTISDTVSRDETIDDFIARRKIDLDIFSIIEATVNEYAGNGQIKLRLKPKVEVPFNQEEFLNAIDKVVAKHSASSSNTNKWDNQTFILEKDEETLLVPTIYDAHIDSPHFTANYVEHLEKMVRTGIAAGHKPSRIMFVIGHDFGHNDNAQYSTTGGTLVGGKYSYIDSIEERCKIILESVSMLRSYTPKLDIVSIPGNHDRYSSIWLSKVVESYWRNDGNVTVMSSGYPRKYYRFGNVLLAMTHGNEEKNTDMIGLMAVEAPMDWAMSSHREWLTGHFHKEAQTYIMVNEKFGVMKRTFSPLIHPDYWHIYKGFIGNDIAGNLLIYNKDTFVADYYFPIK